MRVKRVGFFILDWKNLILRKVELTVPCLNLRNVVVVVRYIVRKIYSCGKEIYVNENRRFSKLNYENRKISCASKFS